MAVLDNVFLYINKSGGSTNEDQDLSLGSDFSTATNRKFVTNFLHNLYDEVEISEAQSGDVEVRHFYFTNVKNFELKNCKLVILSNTKEKWSKVYFAKGTAANGTTEQSVPNENTLPVGIDDDDWISSGELPLGTVASGSWASIWTKRVVLPGSLIVNNEKVSFRIMGDPPAGTGTPTCPAGQHYNPATLQCEADAITCPTGYHLVAGECVPDDGGQGGGGGGGSGAMPEPVRVAALGDIGCTNDGDDAIAFIAALPNLDIFLAVGDLTYTSSPNCLVDNLNAGGIMAKTKIVIGNHDDTEDGSASYRSAALSAFSTPSGGYYNFQVQNVFFIGMDTQRDYSASSAQYTATVAALQTASSSSTVDWIVVYYHKPSLTAPSNHAPLTDFRNLYHPLFDQYKVDLIINGHNHNMQRSYPVKHNTGSPSSPTVMSTAPDNVYTNIDGRIFIVSGAGGDSLYGIDSVPSYTAFTNDNDRGPFFFETENTSTTRSLIGNFVLAQSGSTIEILDAFRINKTV